MTTLLLLALLSTVIASTLAASKDDLLLTDYSFEEFLMDHGKSYATSEEYERRRGIFHDNLATIRRHNALQKHNYTLGINHFADMLEEELPMGLDKSLHSAYGDGVRHFYDLTNTTFEKRYLRQSELPKAVDWRTKESITTAVKNQGHCGSW